jgi:N6-adenosine-specific RNA methylase IME4
MGELAKIDSFKQDIAIAETWDELKMLTTKGSLLAELAKKQQVATDGQNKLGRTRIELEKKKGEWLEKMFPAGGDRKSNLPSTSLKKEGISFEESTDARLINEQEKLVEEVMEETEKSGDIITPNRIATKVRKKKKEIDRENLPTPEPLKGKYRVFYADPPWNYGDKQDTTLLGGAEKHYSTMTIQKLCELPIKQLTEKNAVLFIWVTSPLLDECFEVITAWGFEYKTSFVWDKIKHNMGHYNSVRHELLLVCTKGSCLPDVKKLDDSVYSEERTEHSKKPEYFRTLIDKIYPNGNRIELFAREKINGWDVWGNEV